LPTENFILNISRLDKAKLGTDKYYTKILTELDKHKRKENNRQDALIAETALVNQITLVRNDEILIKVAKGFGVAVCKLTALI